MSRVTVHWLDTEGVVNTGGHEALMTSRGARWRWVDVTAGDIETMDVLAAEFELHPLVVEDALHKQKRPKFDSFPEWVFLTWLYVYDSSDGRLDTDEIDVFIGNDFLVTVHDTELTAVDEVVEESRREPSLGPDWLLHAIIDRLVDSLLPYVEGLGDELDSIEDQLLEQPSTEDLQQLYSIRRRLVRLHKIIAPERDVIRGLARSRMVVGEEAYRYFQDVADHLAHVEDSIDTYRDVGAAAMDIYLSAQNNRMNEIMKQLAVVATIFMPLTLISGIYGMNLLRGMWPPTDAPWSFVAVLITMAGIAAAMSLYFRRKNWW